MHTGYFSALSLSYAYPPQQLMGIDPTPCPTWQQHVHRLLGESEGIPVQFGVDLLGIAFIQSGHPTRIWKELSKDVTDGVQ